MNEIKKYIDNEIEGLLPKRFAITVNQKVMESILQTQKIYSKPKFSESKDNLYLAIGVILTCISIYLFIFNASFTISVELPKNFIYGFLTKLLFGGLIVLFLVNEHFDRKKKVLI